jgi:hypothetical protein
VGKPGDRRTLERSRRRWDNIKIYRRGTGWSGMNWIDLAQDRNQCRTLMKKLMNLRVP